MPPEIRIEHHYPQALVFLREHGPQALAVLHDLLARAERRDGELVVQASTRDIADRLRFLSKDTPAWSPAPPGTAGRNPHRPSPR